MSLTGFIVLLIVLMPLLLLSALIVAFVWTLCLLVAQLLVDTN